jgi:hypothetical protein
MDVIRMSQNDVMQESVKLLPTNQQQSRDFYE